MNRVQKAASVLALSGIAVAAGCAPVTFGLPGTAASLGVLSPSSVQISRSNCLISGGAFGHRLGMNAAAVAGERVQRIQRIAARFSPVSSDIRVQQENWRSIAEGGC